MIRIVIALLLLATPALAQENLTVCRTFDCGRTSPWPGATDASSEISRSYRGQLGAPIATEDDKVLDAFFCRHPGAELGKDGCVVMRPEDAQSRVVSCAPGLERACDERDHGARSSGYPASISQESTEAWRRRQHQEQRP
jgi:hypothetical protein